MHTKSKTLTCLAVISIFALALSACTITTASGSGSIVNLPTSTEMAEVPTATPEPTWTPAPTDTPMPEMIQVVSGQEVTVPILLYHHISDEKQNNRYFVPVSVFSDQMKWLHEHHYQTITLSQLSDLLVNGGEMPKRAVVITFDDGDEDVIANAFPIMQQYGFVGTSFLIVNWINAPGFITTEQVAQISEAGWEIGSHSMNHVDLTQNMNNLQYEIRNSLLQLEQDYSVDVLSFAYPFGEINPDVIGYTSHAGYTGAVGLGESSQHSWSSDLFYMQRIEIRAEYTMDEFIALMPWTD